jgi:hypothetical protein
MRESAEQGPGSRGPGVVDVWNALDRDRRLAAGAAVLLFATMLLPWYQQNAVVTAAKSQPLVSRNLNAFAVFSFVEAAVLLVAVAVLFLLYRRAEGRTFHLPGSDGAVIFAAGIWTAVLLVWRLFDKPGIAHNGVAANVGIQWGIFFALGAAGLLAYAGSRMRAGRRPEPPLMRRGAHPERSPTPHGEHGEHGERGEHGEHEVRGEQRTDDLGAYHPGGSHERSGEAPTVVVPPRGRASREAPVPAAERPRHPPPPRVEPVRPGAPAAGAEQLSFEDPSPSAD